jgi:hypothetical protein
MVRIHLLNHKPFYCSNIRYYFAAALGEATAKITVIEKEY